MVLDASSVFLLYDSLKVVGEEDVFKINLFVFNVRFVLQKYDFHQ